MHPRTVPRSALLRVACGVAALLLASAAAGADLSGSCSNDGQSAPRWLIERFMSADCTDCWTSDTPGPTSRGTVVLDWVVPSASGDDAPMAAVARRDGLERLQALSLPVPEGQSRPAQHRSERTGRQRLRVQHGPVVGDHVGASLAFHAPRGAQGPFTGWLALAEWLPQGTEGSPVARVLVRNLLTEPITTQPDKDWPQLWRPMNIPEGARPARLGVVGWVTDAAGGLVALAQARCTGRR